MINYLDILAATSPLPSQNNLQNIKSPILTHDNFNENFQSQNHYDYSFSNNNWTKKIYEQPPSSPLQSTLISQPLARPTTPVGLIDANIENLQQCQDNDNLVKHLCRSNNNNQTQDFLQYIEQQQRPVHR